MNVTYEVSERDGPPDWEYRVYVSAKTTDYKDQWGYAHWAPGYGATEEEAKAKALTNLEARIAKDTAQRAKIAADWELTRPYEAEARTLAGVKVLTGPTNQRPTKVGERVFVWGHGAYRWGILVELSKTGKVARVLYYTPSQMVRHLTKTNKFWM